VRQNLISSLIVFLVALPLCLGIAVASGVSPEKGIMSGFIGGVVVGALGGSPLQVSGPANSLIVIVADAVNDVGLGGLAVAVFLAGICQIIAGFVGGGRLVRFFPTAVTQGLMTGFAVLIFGSQLHVMFDGKPQASFLGNLSQAPLVFANFVQSIVSGSVNWGGVFGLLSIALLVALTVYQRHLPAYLRKLPAALIVVLCFTVLATLTQVDLKRVHVPDNLMDDFTLPSLSLWLSSINPLVLEIALTIFVLASSESLLSAAAVDNMKPGHVSNFDRELMAQGAGNIICALIGAIPIAGVIIRSTANIAAGATSRWSSILHGVWLLAMVGLFPFIIDKVPLSILGAILIFSVVRLINPKAISRLAETDRWAWPLYLASGITVLVVNPMAGVAVGLFLHFARTMLSSRFLPALQRRRGAAAEANTANERA
jgi:MFS superfamily sulfate permease-like transporter